jgi:acyl carrier protein
VLLLALVRLWLGGRAIDWEAFSRHERRLRRSLPGYVFDRRRYWFEPDRTAGATGPALTIDQLVGGDARRPRPQLEDEPVAPRDELEAAVAEIWQEVLGVEPVGVEDDFFDLGGHSLHITQILGRLRSTLDVELPMARLMESRTVAAVARLVAGQRASNEAGGVQGMRLDDLEGGIL